MASKFSSRALVETMESRTLLTATVVGTPTVTNITKLSGPQENPTIAIDPAHPSVLFAVADNGNSSLFTAVSHDGGHTWTPSVQFDGTTFPAANFLPSVAFDSYGNLFVAYQRSDTFGVEVLYSYDEGANFHQLASLSGIQSSPVLVTGPNVVLLGVQQAKLTGNPQSVAGSGAAMYASRVYGLGRVYPLTRVTDVSGVISDIQGLAVGPAGQFAISYQYTTAAGPSVLYTRTDPDGLGPKPFSVANEQNETQVGEAELIPSQNVAGINAGGSLAYDTSPDQFTGRLYMTYLNAPNPSSTSTNVYLVYSDNDGATWSAPQQVNDDNSGNSHFDPQVAVDPVTGAVGVTWYDARNDDGIPGAGGTDTTPNNDVQVYGAVGTSGETSVSFSPNFVIQPGFSNAGDIIDPLTSAVSTIQLGSRTALVFYNGTMIAGWADDSNSTKDNGDGFGVGGTREPDIYVGVVNVQTSPNPAGTYIGPFGNAAGSLAYTAANGTRVTFSLSGGNGYAFADASGNIELRLSSTTAASSLRVSTAGGTKRIDLSSVSVSGSLGSFYAPSADISGNFEVLGQINRLVLGNATGASITATGAMGSVTLASMSSSDLLSGANPGPNGVFGGAGDPDNSFQAGSINSLVVTGSIVSSVIGAGVNPVDGVFGNGNDTIVGGTASKITRIRTGSADSTSRFEAGAFGTALLPQAVDPAGDPRFVVG